MKKIKINTDTAMKKTDAAEKAEVKDYKSLIAEEITDVWLYCETAELSQ